MLPQLRIYHRVVAKWIAHAALLFIILAFSFLLFLQTSSCFFHNGPTPARAQNRNGDEAIQRQAACTIYFTMTLRSIQSCGISDVKAPENIALLPDRLSLSSCTPFPSRGGSTITWLISEIRVSSSHLILLTRSSSFSPLPTYVSLHSEQQIGAALKAEWCAARRPSSVVLIFPHLKSCHLQ